MFCLLMAFQNMDYFQQIPSQVYNISIKTILLNSVWKIS